MLQRLQIKLSAWPSACLRKGEAAPVDKNTEVSGFFRLSAWIALDQPDTDLQAQVYEITNNGRNSGKAVSDESMADARAVTVTLLHDKAHPSTLYVPLAPPRRPSAAN